MFRESKKSGRKNEGTGGSISRGYRIRDKNLGGKGRHLSTWRHLEDIQAASGGTWTDLETTGEPGRHLLPSGGIRKQFILKPLESSGTLWKHPGGTQKTPRSTQKHPGGSQERLKRPERSWKRSVASRICFRMLQGII